MRKKNFEIRNGLYELERVKGFTATISTPGNFKFGVCEIAGKWRTTELSTGFAVPGSFFDNAEDSVKGAQVAIDSINSKKTYFQGVVAAANLLLKNTKSGSKQ